MSTVLSRAREGWPDRVVLILVLAVGLVLISGASAVGDALSNIAPAPQTSGGLFGAYPLGDYALDAHFSAIKAGVFSGIDVSGIPPMIAFFLANTVWQLTAFLANSLVMVFTWAFSLNLLTGSETGGAGALAPVSAAVRLLYGSVLGEPWLVAAIVAAGGWAMWSALVQRRYTHTASSLAVSVIFVLAALLLVMHPVRTIGGASRWTNTISTAFLSLTDHGTLSSAQAAKHADADQLFRTLVYEPWVVLQFGGIDHCTRTGTSTSVAVQPLPAWAAQQLRSGTEVQVGGRTCVNNANKYASHFLPYASGSDPRDSEYDAVKDGQTSKVPASDPDRSGYRLGPGDEPAVDAMGKGGQYQRLLLALVILAGELGALLLLGALSVGVVVAQIVVLVLLAFAPVALIVAVFPGRGHQLFIGWMQRLAAFLFRKAIYSLILAILLAVSAALVDATSSLGWLLAFLLQAGFFWTVFLYRHQLTGQLSQAVVGHDPRHAPAADLAALYYAKRLLRGTRGGETPSPPPSADLPQQTSPSMSEAAAPGAPGQDDEPPPESPSGPSPDPTPPAPGSASSSDEDADTLEHEGTDLDLEPVVHVTTERAHKDAGDPPHDRPDVPLATPSDAVGDHTSALTRHGPADARPTGKRSARAAIDRSPDDAPDETAPASATDGDRLALPRRSRHDQRTAIGDAPQPTETLDEHGVSGEQLDADLEPLAIEPLPADPSMPADEQGDGAGESTPEERL